MAEVIDLRGQRLARERTPVLLDPSGSRSRALAWLGRGVGVVFLLWLIGLVFAGLRLLPSSVIPFGRALVSQAPSVLKTLPRITQPDLVAPAPEHAALASQAPGFRMADSGAFAGAPEARGGARVGRRGTAITSRGRQHHGSGAGLGASRSSTGAGALPGTAGSAAHPAGGRHSTGSPPGAIRSRSNPGHAKTSSGGFTGSAPNHGHNQRQTRATSSTGTTTTTGKSGSANGHSSGSSHAG